MKSLRTPNVHSLRPKTCVIFPGALGDFICFLPALQALAETAAVDLFARREFAAISPRGVTVASIERPEITRLFTPESTGNGAVQAFFQCYHTVYSWLGSGDENFVLQLRGVTGGCAQIFPFRSLSARSHQRDYYLECLKLKGHALREPLIALRTEAIRWAERFWALHSSQPRPVLAIAPGSGAREKNWPAESFRRVINWWKQANGGTVLLLVGPVEQERGGSEALQSGCVVAKNLDLSQVAALLAGSDAYLGNDSGISHLAAALGVPTMALFGPSDARQWRPRGKKVFLLRRGIDCSPCQELAMKACPHRACLTELPPEEVIASLAKLPELVTLTR